MRCAIVGPLVERYIDGMLERDAARSLSEHAQSCARCRARIQAARSIRAALTAAAPISAPAGFFQHVMDGVYREARAAPRAAAAESRARGFGLSASSLFYRRLGVSLVLTAGVLGASLFLPAAAYTRLLQTGSGKDISWESSGVVRSALAGATSTVRGILGESPRGGDDR